MQVSLQKEAVVLYGSLVRDQPKRTWVLLGVMKGWTLSGMSPIFFFKGWMEGDCDFYRGRAYTYMDWLALV